MKLYGTGKSEQTKRDERDKLFFEKGWTAALKEAKLQKNPMDWIELELFNREGPKSE